MLGYLRRRETLTEELTTGTISVTGGSGPSASLPLLADGVGMACLGSPYIFTPAARNNARGTFNTGC